MLFCACIIINVFMNIYRKMWPKPPAPAPGLLSKLDCFVLTLTRSLHGIFSQTFHYNARFARAPFQSPESFENLTPVCYSLTARFFLLSWELGWDKTFLAVETTLCGTFSHPAEIKTKMPKPVNWPLNLIKMRINPQPQKGAPRRVSWACVLFIRKSGSSEWFRTLVFVLRSVCFVFQDKEI